MQQDTRKIFFREKLKLLIILRGWKHIVAFLRVTFLRVTFMTMNNLNIYLVKVYHDDYEMGRRRENYGEKRS